MKCDVKMLVGCMVMIAVLLGGCSKNTFNPEDIISKALETDGNISYYGELTATFEGGAEEMEHMPMREWRHGKSSKVEVETPEGLVSTSTDGDSMIIYNESEQIAYYSEDDSFLDLQMDPREELDMVLDLVKETHDTKNIGEEEIAGRPAIHLKLVKRKEEKSLFGNQELWVDKENWMVLKMISVSGNMRNEIAYDRIDFNMKNDPSAFELNLPDDVEIKDFDNVEADMIDEEISLKDVPEKLGENVLHFPDNENHQLDTITYLESKTGAGFQDVTIDYKQDDAPLLTFTVLKREDEEIDDLSEVLGEAMERDEIRGQDAVVTDAGDFRSISWSEGDYQYSVTLIEPNMTLDQLRSWTEEMEEIDT